MEQSLASEPITQMAAHGVARSFLACLKNARHETRPFDYWLLENPLPDGCCDDIAILPFPPPENAIFSGKRETNNAQRIYFTIENQAKFDVCRQVVEGFKNPCVKNAIEDATGAQHHVE